MRRLDLVEDYIRVYRGRISAAYRATEEALVRCRIPMAPATSGLFILIDLSDWVGCFDGPDADSHDPGNLKTREIQLCWWLVDRGVFLNPGQVGSQQVYEKRLQRDLS